MLVFSMNFTCVIKIIFPAYVCIYMCFTHTLFRLRFILQQIQELVEAIVLPMTHKERFQKLGVRPPKGVLLYGPPGTGKTLMARACAAQTNATFLKLAGPQLVQVGFYFTLIPYMCFSLNYVHFYSDLYPPVQVYLYFLLG